MEKEKKKKQEEIVLVMGVLGEDTHAVFNEILQKLLDSALVKTKKGNIISFSVENIGVASPLPKFIESAVKVKANVMLISSLYGHAEQDCEGIRRKCDKSGLKDILLYIGGNLGVGKQNSEETERKFKEIGFDRVYLADEKITFCSIIRQFLHNLEEDLDVKITIPKEEIEE